MSPLILAIKAMPYACALVKILMIMNDGEPSVVLQCGPVRSLIIYLWN